MNALVVGEHGDDHDYEKTLRIDFAKTGSRFDLLERAKNWLWRLANSRR